MAGIGLHNHKSSSEVHAIIALTALSSATLCFSWDPLNYIITTELPASRLRDKTQRVASFVNVATNFTFSFSTPYLLDALYADLGSKVGFIYGSLAVASFLFAYFCVPEMKGRTLEEVNRMFQNGVPIWKFGIYGNGPTTAEPEPPEMAEASSAGEVLVEVEIERYAGKEN